MQRQRRREETVLGKGCRKDLSKKEKEWVEPFVEPAD
jgi:hypothetical protein